MSSARPIQRQGKGQRRRVRKVPGLHLSPEEVVVLHELILDCEFEDDVRPEEKSLFERVKSYKRSMAASIRKPHG